MDKANSGDDKEKLLAPQTSFNIEDFKLDEVQASKACWIARWLGWDNYFTKTLGYRSRWASRTLYTDWFVDWQSPFVEYCYKQKQVKPEFLHSISQQEQASALYDKWVATSKANGTTIKRLIWRLVIQGMCRYGFQLMLAELFTIGAIYNIRLIINYLNNGDQIIQNYNYILFVAFCFCRFMAVLIRNYYDLHVYNFYRYVQTAV